MSKKISEEKIQSQEVVPPIHTEINFYEMAIEELRKRLADTRNELRDTQHDLNAAQTKISYLEKDKADLLRQTLQYRNCLAMIQLEVNKYLD